MKNRIKRAVIAAGALIVIGVIGSIFSGIRLVPTITSEISRVQNASASSTPIESQVYSSEQNVGTISIESIEKSNINVEIKKSYSEKVTVKAYEYTNNNMKVNTRYDADSSTLYVEGYTKKTDIFKANSLKKKILGLYNNVIYTLAKDKNTTSQIVIEVPQGVDINFISSHQSNLVIRNKDVLKDKLSFKSLGGTIELPSSNSLRDISIDTHGYIRLDVLNFINADNVNIKGYNIDIISGDVLSNYYDITNFPSTVKLDGDIINVNSYIPLGDNVTLNGGEVSYMSDFEKYPIKLHLGGEMASKCTYTESKSNAFYTRKLELKGDYSGIIGEGMKAQYNLEINNYNICELKNR